VNAGSIFLAGRNSIHTWWTGIVGCLLFAWVFLEARLYADATLQVFFVVTSAIGWWTWRRGADANAPDLPVRRERPWTFAGMLVSGACAAAGYGWLLHRFTNAYAPFIDSAVLALSVLAQLLLMRRRYETWWCWLAANTIIVPLYISRGLTVTALLYVFFWINAAVALRRWRRLIQTA
jgi:nicotinamide mononucleotide transporter